MVLDTSGTVTAEPTGAAGATPVVIDARGVSRTFDGRGVLRDIDLQVRRGEFVALLGRSGSGKSTLLRILAKLDTEAQGTIRVPALPGVAFQDSRLLPWARVLPNVLLGLRDSAARDRARTLLDDVGLGDRTRAWPRQLSGGEQQRVALARALAAAPELLLMDEPFGALDALTRIKMHRLLRDLVARYSPAVVLVTHDVDEAVLLADRVLVLTDGRLSLDERIDLPTVGRRAHPGFAALRARLLAELGVGDDDH